MSNTKDLSKIPDNVAYVSDYTELRAYTGKARSIYVTGYLATAVPSGIAGLFVKDNTDITSLDNGGTILINSSNVQLTSHDGVAQIGPITPHAWAVNDNIQFSYSFPI